MKRFVVPPNWPSPPRRSWVPPKTWRPDPSWPPAPEGWHFWVDGKGNPVRGPIGQYGGPSRRVVYAGGGALVLFLAVNLWAVSALGLFGGDSDDAAVKILGRQSPSPTASSTATPAVPRSTVTPPRVPTTSVPTRTPTQRPTQRPTRRPSSTKTTERTPTPKPTRTTTSTKTPTPTPTRPTSRPSTREEILRQYCIDHGWDPSLCDPSRWETPQHP
ncbi:hypothetical protein [Kribbella sp. NPDC000426]|uniref:hypothetical protein n=1 Tax=Kribbella sp. NPDC000426 TaxID=3154255 RepID=UPI003327906D